MLLLLFVVVMSSATSFRTVNQEPPGWSVWLALERCTEMHTSDETLILPVAYWVRLIVTDATSILSLTSDVVGVSDRTPRRWEVEESSKRAN